MKQSIGVFKLFSILLIDNADPIDAAATVMFGLITLLQLSEYGDIDIKLELQKVFQKTWWLHRLCHNRLLVQQLKKVCTFQRSLSFGHESRKREL